MYNECRKEAYSNIIFINAKTKGNGSDNNTNLARIEAMLDLLSQGRVETCMVISNLNIERIRNSYLVVLLMEIGIDIFSLLSSIGINDAALTLLVVGGGEQLHQGSKPKESIEKGENTCLESDERRQKYSLVSILHYKRRDHQSTEGWRWSKR